MSNEIKAILIQNGEPTPESPIEIKRLLVNKEAEDYITNLQEENKRLKKENTKLYKKYTKIINELKEELEITQEKWNKDKQWSECRTKEWLDYKSRCEKAIEYIERAEVSSIGTPYSFTKRGKDLLNILNGGDK